MLVPFPSITIQPSSDACDLNYILSTNANWASESAASVTHQSGIDTSFITEGISDISTSIYGQSTFTLTIEDSSNSAKAIVITYDVTVIHRCDINRL